MNVTSGIKVKDAFYYEFDRNYSAPLLESHIKLILSKRTNFVGTKTLVSALKFMQIALRCKRSRTLIKD